MRGGSTGALSRAYLHSATAEVLLYSVMEAEQLFHARLSHAVMLSSLYGNPRADLDQGNDQVHEMYLNALRALPYFRPALKKSSKRETDELVEAWRRENEGVSGKEGGDA